MKSRFIICFFILVLTGAPAFAFPILRLTGNPNGYAGLNNGVFQTIDANGASAVTPTSLNFDGDISSVADIANAFFSLENVRNSGKATQANGKVSQQTLGGSIKIYADAGKSNLILEGNLGMGSLNGVLGNPNNGSASHVSYETWGLNVTGGSILGKLPSPMLDLVLNFDISNCLVFSKRCFLASTPEPYLSLGSDGSLSAFQSKFIDGLSNGKGITSNPPPTSPVPEPTSLALFLAGAAILGNRKTKTKGLI